MVPDSNLYALAIVALIVAVFACVALYVALQWYLLRRFGSVVVLLVWLAVTFGLAYVGFRRTCNQGLTCDVGGVDYRWVYIPPLAFILGTALGPCTLLVLRRAHRAAWPGRRDLLIAATGFVICCFAAPGILMALDRATCGNRVLRRADGAYITECEYRAEQ